MSVQSRYRFRAVQGIFLVCALGVSCSSGDTSTASDTGGGDSGGEVSQCEGGCLIDSVCHGAGDARPENPCQHCDPGVSTTNWSDNDGASCDDGVFCNGADTCENAQCSVHDGDPCVGQLTCNSPGVCHEESDTCGPGDFDGCWIDSECHDDGEPDPDNPCQHCDPGLTKTAWSDNDGAACNDDQFCNGDDTCEGGLCAAHAGDPCPDDLLCNGTDSCNEEDDVCEHTGNPCIDDSFCNGIETCTEPDEGPDVTCDSPGDPCFDGGDLCNEDTDECCVPDHHLGCNGDGDVVYYDSCNREMPGGTVVDNCHDVLGTCVDAACGCIPGYLGAGCNIRHIHVRQTGGSDDNAGITWEDALASLTAALTMANEVINDADNGIDACEVWVAAGTYLPGTERTDSFVLQPGIHLYGGFAGDETELSQRDLKANETTLSGEVGLVDHLYDNVYHVLVGANDSTVDGFSITRGSASEDSGNLKHGGGMLNIGASPTVRNCVFFDNYANNGAAMHNYGASPTVVNCDFFKNRSNSSGGVVSNYEGSNSRFFNCRFIDNYGDDGGGMANGNSYPTIVNCLFAHNEANWYGGMACTGGATTIVNSTFVYNESGYGASALSSTYGSTVNMTNSIVYHNRRIPGYGPPLAPFDTNAGTLNITNSNIQGGWTGTGNINQDVAFVKSALPDPDFHLTATDPGLDAGDESLMVTDLVDLDGDGDTTDPVPFDLAGNDRVMGDAVDMGAYEYVPECGDSFAQGDEECDDGNKESGDGCSPTCTCEQPGTFEGCPVEACSSLDPATSGDGIYWLVSMESGQTYRAYCDMSTDGGGWTMALRFDSNDATTQWYGAKTFWESNSEVGVLESGFDYLSPAYYTLSDFSEILLDYRYTDGQAKRMAAVFASQNNDSLYEHAVLYPPDNGNPPWTRTMAFSEGADADAEGWYGDILRFQTIGNEPAVGEGTDNFRIWYNRVPVDACNQAGGIGGQGDGGAWAHELSFPSATPGCQENTHRGTIGTNGFGNLMDEAPLTPVDAYDQGIMNVYVR